MLDVNLIREKPEEVKKNLALRRDASFLEKLNKVIEKDEEWRKTKQEIDRLRHRRNQISKEINKAKKQRQVGGIRNLIQQAKQTARGLQEIEEKEKKLKQETKNLMFEIPNLLDKGVPEGKNEGDNKETKRWGKKPRILKPLSHAELGKNLSIIDLKTATKIAGSGFYILKKEAAALELALINFMLDFHRKKGKTEIWSPILVKPKTAIGTAHLPKFDKDMYKTREGFYLIPTAEMTLTNLHAGELLNENELPKHYFGYTPCFRTEAGKHGIETIGIYRVHQFDKVEMVTVCKPEDEKKELKNMLSDAEELVKKLKIPYRVIALCSGDMGFKESVTYDIGTWSPFLEKYMETSSISSCKDFQARRMNTKYLEKKTGQRKYVYTLNGSGLALPRLMISILENYQQKDGSVKIPSVLWKYTDFKKIEAKNKK